ncbi:MAG: DUF1934 domain-containing protein [Clostridia bacterium]|nr:DUF1934 domain-containing protein [Clostridia bacterium]
MQKEVIISIQGMEKMQEDSEAVNTKLVTEGKYYKKGDKHYLSYKETEATGFGATTTMLKIEKDAVSVTRYGQINSHMIFKNGERHTGHYETPFGSFTIGVVSDAVRVEMEEGKGLIDIHYMLEIDNNTRAEHQLSLHVQEME